MVFATDGTPAGYGLERKYGSLQAYTGLRFQEAARALSHVPNSTFKWLTGTDGSYFADMHVYEDLPAAATSSPRDCASIRSRRNRLPHV